MATETDPPPRPSSMDPDELGFKPGRMFGWLGPVGLLQTAEKVLLSGEFARYSDKREVEASLPTPHVLDRSLQQEVWIDYLADTGDGFDSTYAMARLLANEILPVDGHTLPRGQILVLGGDQVYPAASEARYLDRFIGPYRCALPWSPYGSTPAMFVVPGNHDWYDGLTSFMRLLCRGEWVGGWRTEQERSYFAIKLPGQWWLWGIDIQFDAYIDNPQLEYFDGLAKGELGQGFPRVEPGDRILLCTGKPSWVHEGLAGDKKYKGKRLQGQLRAPRNLQYFEEKIIRANGAHVVLGLSGDLHHYARYERADGRVHRITSGGGGAYLYPTHGLSAKIQWPDEDEPASPATYPLAAVYPDIATSQRLRWGALFVPKTNPSFMGLTAGVHLILLWVVLFGLAPGGRGAAEALAAGGWGTDGLALIRNPVGLILTLMVLAGLIGFADALRLREKLLMGVPHAAAHVLAAITIIWGAARIPGLHGLLYLAVVAIEVVAAGGLAGSLIMGGYLTLAQLNVFKRHPNENFAGQHIADYKNFLRLCVRTDGTVTVFPIGLDRVPRDWRVATTGAPGSPWLEPDGPEARPHLIEPPIQITP